jgi:hypothetical protein
VTLFDAETCRAVVNLANRIDWSRDGALVGGIAESTDTERAWLWDARERRLGLLKVPAHDLRIHPGGKLVIAAREGVARFWDAATARQVGPPLDHPRRIRTLDVRGDGRLLMTCCNDEWARLWDVPAPVPGTPERLRLWIEILTGRRLDEMGVPQVLNEAALEPRRRRLAELGGAPLP